MRLKSWRWGTLEFLEGFLDWLLSQFFHGCLYYLQLLPQPSYEGIFFLVAESISRGQFSHGKSPISQ
jgi:hypothetical protein